MSNKKMTTGTKEDAKPALVPKLRFPEFRGAEGWVPKRLGLALKFQPGFPFPSSGFNDTGKGLRLIRNRDLRSDDIIVCYSEAFDPNFVVNDGDVLVGMDGDFTPTVWNKGRALLNQRVGRILPREDNNLRFLLYLLTICLKGIEDTTARTTVKHLSHSVIEDRYEPLPSPAEQQNIAECLSSVDEGIAAQARKMDALKTHKKGLMQQLFPREGETQPRLRFSEFQNDGDWEARTLADIAEISSGTTPLRSNSDFFNGGTISWVKTTDLNNAFITRTEEKITPKARARINPIGSVLVAMYGGFNQIGRTGYLSVPAATNQALSVLVLDQDLVSPIYVLTWLNAKVDDWKRIASSSRKDPNITSSDVAKFPISLPSQTEQHRIASCLSSLDILITAETQKLEALKRHKRGLMQQLFPSQKEDEA